MTWELATPVRIVFGAGALSGAGAHAAALGQRALVVVGRGRERARPLLEALGESGVEASVYSVAGEPTLDTAREGCALARAAGCELVVGFGGGSVLDTAKAVALLLTNGGDPLDYLEVVGRGAPVRLPSAPLIAIPTTAGTGSEVTRNAVLASPAHGVKASLRSPHLLPRLALVDPLLTHGVPPAVTAATGLDALTQVLEPFVSCRASPLTDPLCRDGMRRAARSLVRACQRGDDAPAREDLALTSLFGGLALANAGLGAAHGFAGPLGGMFEAPHGLLCARLLPAVMAVNVRALAQRAPGGEALRRYDEVAQLLTGEPSARATDGVAWVEALCRTLDVPPLSQHGVGAAHLPELVQKAAGASSMKGNPLVLTPAELREVLERAL